MTELRQQYEEILKDRIDDQIKEECDLLTSPSFTDNIVSVKEFIWKTVA